MWIGVKCIYKNKKYRKQRKKLGATNMKEIATKMKGKEGVKTK